MEAHGYGYFDKPFYFSGAPETEILSHNFFSLQQIILQVKGAIITIASGHKPDSIKQRN